MAVRGVQALLGLCALLAGATAAALWSVGGRRTVEAVAPAGRPAPAPGAGEPARDELAERARERALTTPGAPAVRSALEGDERRPSTLVPLRVRVRATGAEEALHEARVAASDGASPARTASRVDRETLELALPPGAWTVVASAPGYEALAQAITLRPHERERALELTLVPKPSARVVVVEPDGRPWRVSGAAARAVHALATPGDPGARLGAEASAWSECGRFRPGSDARVPGMLGLLELDCAPPCFVSLACGGEVLATRRLEAPCAEVRFELARSALDARVASLRVRCADARGGAPLMQAELTLLCAGDARFSSSGPCDDVLRVAGLPPGEALLQIDAPGYAPLVRAVQLESGRELDLGRVLLERADEPRLRVALQAPDGLVGARLWWCPTRTASGRPLRRELAEASGELRPGRGSFLVWATAAGGLPLASRRVQVELDAREEALVLALEPLARLVLEPAAGARSVELRDARGGTPLASAEVAHAPAVLELAPGPYVLDLRGANGLRRSLALELPPEGARLPLP